MFKGDFHQRKHSQNANLGGLTVCALSTGYGALDSQFDQFGKRSFQNWFWSGCSSYRPKSKVRCSGTYSEGNFVI